MSLSMYQASIPVFVRRLKTLSAILKKGAAHAKARGIDPAVLVNARLAPNMFPLSRQVQIASDMVKGAAGRLAGVDIPSWPDNEATFTELQQRISNTIAFVKTIKPAQLDGTEQKQITLQIPAGSLGFSGQAYLQDWVLPNLYFHMSTAYNILRHNGVELGKADFLGITPPGTKSTGRKKRQAKSKA